MRGQAFLALVLLIGGFIVLAAITLSFLAVSFGNTGYGYRAQMVARTVATSGAEDGLLQLDRNTNFSSTGYSFTVASNTATVSVTQDTPSAGFVTVSSTATVSLRTATMLVVTAVNASTSQVSVISWQMTP